MLIKPTFYSFCTPIDVSNLFGLAPALVGQMNAFWSKCDFLAAFTARSCLPAYSAFALHIKIRRSSRLCYYVGVDL